MEHEPVTDKPVTNGNPHASVIRDILAHTVVAPHQAFPIISPRRPAQATNTLVVALATPAPGSVEKAADKVRCIAASCQLACTLTSYREYDDLRVWSPSATAQLGPHPDLAPYSQLKA